MYFCLQLQLKMALQILHLSSILAPLLLFKIDPIRWPDLLFMSSHGETKLILTVSFPINVFTIVLVSSCG